MADGGFVDVFRKNLGWWSSVPITGPPYCVEAVQAYAAGAVASQGYSPGAVASDGYTAGAVAMEDGCGC